MSSRTFNITTYALEELLGTKLRAPYQRRKGRDLFDLATALEKTSVDPARIVEAFSGYMKNEGKRITRALFERNLAAKLNTPQFSANIGPLLASGYKWDKDHAAEIVSARLLARLPGDAWKQPKKCNGPVWDERSHECTSEMSWSLIL